MQGDNDSHVAHQFIEPGACATTGRSKHLICLMLDVIANFPASDYRPDTRRVAGNYFAGLVSGGITSDGLTQFTLNGPMPLTCTMVAVLLRAKWRICFGTLAKFPAVMDSSFEASNFSPMPT